jgi:uncharacterized protein YlxW (UPF0749 family)
MDVKKFHNLSTKLERKMKELAILESNKMKELAKLEAKKIKLENEIKNLENQLQQLLQGNQLQQNTMRQNTINKHGMFGRN